MVKTKTHTRRHADYLEVLRSDHPFANTMGYVMEHRIVIEKYLRENNPQHPCLVKINDVLYLRKEWQVHHRDRNKTNNTPENLLPTTSKKHISLESIWCFTCPFCKKQSEINKAIFVK